ncbi:endonuclease domain-containing 1 protein-like [Anguilla rostrata]|uniref:endonuclease domain-containing 1 protein-like n=1 Tax=Anguilla rostrata TaxID=7938 RepID=UPI0030D61A82
MTSSRAPGRALGLARARARAALPALLLLQAGALVGVARASVEAHLSPECRAFLYRGTAPAGLESPSLRRICQRYGGRARYVTLYDTAGRAPVYSAYTFKRSDGERRANAPWMFEPQLSASSGSREMQPMGRGEASRSLEDAQAVLEDYDDAAGYERGQLNPDEHQADPGDKAATYALTNAVPQAREFRAGPWAEQLHAVRRRLNNYCRGVAYVVTGVTGAGHAIRRQSADRVAVPACMWSAYCCVDFDRSAPYGERHKLPAFAHYGLNDRRNNQVSEMPVGKLEEFLKGSTYVEKSFRIFADDCVPPPPVRP